MRRMWADLRSLYDHLHHAKSIVGSYGKLPLSTIATMVLPCCCHEILPLPLKLNARKTRATTTATSSLS